MKAIKQDKQGIERFIGMTWKRARRELKNNTHLLVLTDKPDDRAVEVATMCRDHGIDAGLATLCSHLYIQKNGSTAGAMQAIQIYREICHSFMSSRSRGALRQKAENLQHELVNLENMCVYANCSLGRGYGWPLKPEFTKRHQRAGLANIMLYLAYKGLMHEGTTSQIAALGIQRFLDKGFKKS